MIPSSYYNFLINTAFPANVNVMCKGQPGGGKTDVNMLAANRFCDNVFLFHPVVDDPTDYKGFPFCWVDPSTGKREADFVTFAKLRQLQDMKEPAVVVLDDMGQASKLVQAAAMQFVWGREINGIVIGDEVRFVLITNRRTDKAGVEQMLEPLKGRTCIVLFEPSMPDWVEWALKNQQPPMLIAFNQARPSHLMQGFKPSKSFTNCPTPRTIAMMGDLINQGIDKKAKEEVYTGCVGSQMATEYLAFETMSGMPNPQDAIDDPDNFPLPKKEEIRFALSQGLSALATKDNMDSVIRFLGRMPEEHAICVIRDASHRNPKIGRSKAFQDWMQKNQDVILMNGVWGNL
ncbi:MAG: hypothetical protein ACYSOO_06455 [Planctomycetota bacterium]